MMTMGEREALKMVTAALRELFGLLEEHQDDAPWYLRKHYVHTVNALKASETLFNPDPDEHDVIPLGKKVGGPYVKKVPRGRVEQGQTINWPSGVRTEVVKVEHLDDETDLVTYQDYL